MVRDLSEASARAAKLIWGHTGKRTDSVQLAVVLPPVIEDHLAIIKQHCDDIEAEYNAAIVALVEMGVRRLDIMHVLALHSRSPRRLTVSHREVAEHGLTLCGDAIGVEWDDHGFALTRLCRGHVEADRHTYRELDPSGLSALVYPGDAFQCDRCYEGDDLRDGEHSEISR